VWLASAAVLRCCGAAVLQCCSAVVSRCRITASRAHALPAPLDLSFATVKFASSPLLHLKSAIVKHASSPLPHLESAIGRPAMPCTVRSSTVSPACWSSCTNCQCPYCCGDSSQTCKSHVIYARERLFTCAFDVGGAGICVG
jgi:hypothetical protein